MLPLQALWTKEPRSVTASDHEDFYRFIANAYDEPRYYLHYRADAPLDIKAIFYVPKDKPSEFACCAFVRRYVSSVECAH